MAHSMALLYGPMVYGLYGPMEAAICSSVTIVSLLAACQHVRSDQLPLLDHLILIMSGYLSVNPSFFLSVCLTVCLSIFSDLLNQW